MTLRDYTFIGTTESLCPECLSLVPAKVITRGKRVYFRKRCPTHGVREDFVCSDVAHYNRHEFSVPGRKSEVYGTEPKKGCPFDCGLCTEHEQHTCVGLVELTSSCNLSCPMCYASSGPGGEHLSFEQCTAAIDRLVEAEGRAEVLQLSGGEPTLHPQFAEVFEYACRQPIDIVMINTNGIRLANDSALLDLLAAQRHRIEIYFQFDGFRETTSRQLRGESLVDTKLRAIEKLGERRLRTTLVTTLQGDLNLDEVGAITQFALERPWITGVSFQPATYSGRWVTPESLEQRVTFPDVIEALVQQCGGLFEPADFMPVPCAHPNCHTLSYVYRGTEQPTPVSRFINAAEHLDLLANGITFNRTRARELVETYLGRQGCCAGGSCLPEQSQSADTVLPVITTANPASGTLDRQSEEFFSRALAEQLDPEDVFRVTITSFLDAYNFDVQRVMKCCIHHVLPSGHIIPFCAYNVLYREGHVPLPPLQQELGQANGRPLGDRKPLLTAGNE